MLNRRIKVCIEAEGFEVSALHGMGVQDAETAAITPEAIYAFVQSRIGPRVPGDALFLSSTNYQALGALSLLKITYEVPIVTSNLAMLQAVKRELDRLRESMLKGRPYLSFTTAVREPVPIAGPATATTLDTEFHRGLGLFDSTMVVVGSMIGSGIFIVSADMARNIGSPGWLLVAWVVTGVLTVVGALSYGELAAMMPRAGGQYVYLREAFSPLWGFLYGWTLFLVIQTGTIAAVAVGFARYFGVLVPVDRRRPLPDRAGSSVDRLRAVALDGAAGRHRADRAADVDQHARPRSTARSSRTSSPRRRPARCSG